MQTIAAKRREPNVKVEFVLDAEGRSPANLASLRLGDNQTYANYFSVHDIFQGELGDCFLVACILGMTRNRAMLEHVMPLDNANESNKRVGAYHFRLWRLGDWYDVVVDDWLALKDSTLQLVFTRNVTYPNEYWTALLEKAVAK